jgi:hypothetical protein
MGFLSVVALAVALSSALRTCSHRSMDDVGEDVGPVFEITSLPAVDKPMRGFPRARRSSADCHRAQRSTGCRSKRRRGDRLGERAGRCRVGDAEERCGVTASVEWQPRLVVARGCGPRSGHRQCGSSRTVPSGPARRASATLRQRTWRADRMPRRQPATSNLHVTHQVPMTEHLNERSQLVVRQVAGSTAIDRSRVESAYGLASKQIGPLSSHRLSNGSSRPEPDRAGLAWSSAHG